MSPYAGCSSAFEATVRNCTIEKDVVIGYDRNENEIGAIAGRMQGTVENCVSYAIVYGTSYVGGIIGTRDNAMGNCSVLYDQEKNRVKWIVDTAKARSAKGVLVVLTKFCDPEEFDYVMIKKACEAADLPLTLVEVDRQMVRFEQVRTNLETFRDLLKM